MLVTPLRDGMNLVAKEYVACRSDLGGALVLSEFTGAAAELRQAFQANPYDTDGVKEAILAALEQDPEEGKRRMRALRRQVLTHDVQRWAKSFLGALGADTDTMPSANRSLDVV
jgi:trehalose 6-phosphate synthase